MELWFWTIMMIMPYNRNIHFFYCFLRPATAFTAIQFSKCCSYVFCSNWTQRTGVFFVSGFYLSDAHKEYVFRLFSEKRLLRYQRPLVVRCDSDLCSPFDPPLDFHAVLVRYLEIVPMDSRYNSKVTWRLLEFHKILAHKQVEHTPNPQHSNSLQHFEYFPNQKVRGSRNE